MKLSKLSIAVIALNSSVLADKYAPGAICRRNRECDDNCINKWWKKL